jgi:hypothetical protein
MQRILLHKLYSMNETELCGICVLWWIQQARYKLRELISSVLQQHSLCSEHANPTSLSWQQCNFQGKNMCVFMSSLLYSVVIPGIKPLSHGAHGRRKADMQQHYNNLVHIYSAGFLALAQVLPPVRTLVLPNENKFKWLRCRLVLQIYVISLSPINSLIHRVCLVPSNVVEEFTYMT